VDVDLSDELRYHLEQEIENNLRAGMPSEEARYAAQRLTGPVSLYQEECRDARGVRFLDTLVHDLRYALRTFRRTPLFTATAILTLALGVGANTTVFTFIENILLRPLSVRDPQQLLFLNRGDSVTISFPNYLDFRNRNVVFSDLIACRYMPANLSIRARENLRVWGYEATGNYFQTLGITPLLGRFFGPETDDKPGAHPVTVLSYHYWQSHFAADPNIIGRQVKINGHPFTVVAVARPGFGGTELIMSSDFWVPMSMEGQIEPGHNWLFSRGTNTIWTIGRLKPGVSRIKAEANLNAVARQLARIYPNDISAKTKFRLSRPGLVGEAFRKPVTGVGIVLMGIAALGLLLACINLAIMLLARASDRRREVGIRLALGASRRQLLRQLMTENLILAMSGGLSGFALTFAACRLFSSWHPDFDFPANILLQPNRTVLAFTAAAALCTTLLFGLAPALQALHIDLIPSLKNEPEFRPMRHWSFLDVLVIGQIALSIALVICSVLVTRSLQNALNIRLGFNPDHAVAVSFDLSLQGYSQERSRRFDEELLSKAAALPGLNSVGIVSNLPLRVGEDMGAISRADRPLPAVSEALGAVIYYISPGYLRTAGTRLLAGRDVTSRDRTNSQPIVIVNETCARVLFGKEDPLGKHIRLGSYPYNFEVIGVVETGKYESLGEDPHPAVFLPIAQTGTRWTTLVARTSLPGEQAVKLLRKTVLDLDPETTLFNVGSLKGQLASALFPARITAAVLSVFGVFAMTLAATGLFALVAYSVSRRKREIGIRMALGARHRQVLASVLGRTLVLCGIGVAVGSALTFAAGRLLSAVLYGVSPRDPATYLIAIALMSGVALLACWQPTMRAILIDPAYTLREE
jgi:predicted permease